MCQIVILKGKTMITQEICKSIRLLVKGEKPDCDISDFLYQNGGEYLLYKSNDQKYSHCLCQVATKNADLIREQVRLFRRFLEEPPIQYVILNESVLSYSVYGKVFNTVPQQELILFIRSEDLLCLKEWMANNYYVETSYAQSDIVTYTQKFSSELCPCLSIKVISFLPFAIEPPFIDSSVIWQHICKKEYFGVAVNRIDSVTEFILLCKYCFRLLKSTDDESNLLQYFGKLSDMYFYLINCKPNKERLAILSKRLQTNTCLYHCINLVDKIFDDQAIRDYRNIFG